MKILTLEAIAKASMIILALQINGTYCYAETGCKTLPDSQTLFNVNLSKPAVKLLAEVEQKYGRKVRQEEKTSLAEFARCLIDDDGTPVIIIDPVRGRKESHLVHELFHLKLKYEGYPGFTLHLSPEVNNDTNRQNVLWILNNIYDPITHWMFYPEMRKIGVDPSVDIKDTFKDALNNDKYDGLNPETQSGILAIFYLKAGLELNDDKMLARIADWYLKKGWNEPLETGKILLRYVLESDPKTAEDSVLVFLKCINFINKGVVKFDVVKWTTNSLGPIMIRMVEINISPSTMHSE